MSESVTVLHSFLGLMSLLADASIASVAVMHHIAKRAVRRG